MPSNGNIYLLMEINENIFCNPGVGTVSKEVLTDWNILFVMKRKEEKKIIIMNVPIYWRKMVVADVYLLM